MTKTALDATDHRILAILRVRGREPTASLARRVGLSRSAVQERLDRLTAAGVIRGYTVRLAADLVTAPVEAFVTVRLGRTECARVVPVLKRIPGVVDCHSVTGEIDMILKVEADSAAAIGAIRDEVLRVPGVAAATTHMVVDPGTRG